MKSVSVWSLQVGDSGGRRLRQVGDFEAVQLLQLWFMDFRLLLFFGLQLPPAGQNFEKWRLLLDVDDFGKFFEDIADLELWIFADFYWTAKTFDFDSQKIDIAASWLSSILCQIAIK